MVEEEIKKEEHKNPCWWCYIVLFICLLLIGGSLNAEFHWVEYMRGLIA